MAAAAEERFSRRKHDPSLPVQAFRFCLDRAGISVAELDAVAYYEEPVPKLARQLWAGGEPSEPTASLAWLDPEAAERNLREGLGFDGPILRFPHHLSHAASSYFVSGFSEAAVLTADGVGEWATTTYGHARGDEIEIFEEVLFPHSLGLLYSTVTAFLGFRVNGGEAKVMGLAPYGETRYLDQICQLVGMGPDGQYLLNLRYFDFLDGKTMFSPALANLFGVPPRQPESKILQAHRDIAASLQYVVEEILLEKASWLARQTGARQLCLAGGVALNCVANGRLRRESPFEEVFVQPAAGDAGASLGAALLAHHDRRSSHHLSNRSLRDNADRSISPTPLRSAPPALRSAPPALRSASPALRSASPRSVLRSVFLGPSYSADLIARRLEAADLVDAPGVEDHRGSEGALLESTAARLAEGQVVGWFHGAMEFGPRALGGRSILADPRDSAMRERINRMVKKRETFRPFAPVVLAEDAARCFELDGPTLLTPFMLETCQVRTDLELPAITHVDGSARPQTVDPATAPRYAALLRAFARQTGCPVLLNTSFNVRGEPIVCSPVDALLCFADSGLDALVLEDFLLDRSALPPHWTELLPLWRVQSPARRHNLYTFV